MIVLRNTYIFSKRFNFIGDLCTFNKDNLETVTVIIILMSWNSRKKITFLIKVFFFNNFFNNLTIICDRKFTTKLGNKKGAFPFYINYMYHLESNVPSKIFCASIDFQRLPYIYNIMVSLQTTSISVL